MDNNVDLRMAADGIVNPLTSLCLLKILRDEKADFVVLDGASTSMGRMLIKLFMKENIEFLPIAMDKQNFEELRSKYNLDRAMD